MIKRPPTSAAAEKPATDLPFQEPAKPIEIKGSKQVQMDTKQETNETVNIDFVDGAYGGNMASAQTKLADDAPKMNPDTPADKVREDVKKYEDSKSKTLTFKHYQEIAGFLIHIVDVGVSNALNWFAKDTARSAYTLQKADKDSLTDQLALILCKYQSKFSIEFTFLLALIVIYSGPFMTAFRKKKELAAEPIAQAKIDNPDKAFVRHEPFSKSAEQIKEVQKVEIIKEQSVAPVAPVIRAVGQRPPTSRRRGGQAKS